MDQKELNKLGETVREQGYEGSTMMDLVFNPATGEFEQVPKGKAHEGDVVTEMTRDGFACAQ